MSTIKNITTYIILQITLSPSSPSSLWPLKKAWPSSFPFTHNAAAIPSNHPFSQLVQTKHPKSRTQNMQNYPQGLFLKSNVSLSFSWWEPIQPTRAQEQNEKIQLSHISFSTIDLNLRHQNFRHTWQRNTAYEYRLCFYMIEIISEMGVWQLKLCFEIFL